MFVIMLGVLSSFVKAGKSEARWDTTDEDYFSSFHIGFNVDVGTFNHIIFLRT